MAGSKYQHEKRQKELKKKKRKEEKRQRKLDKADTPLENGSGQPQDEEQNE